MQALETRALHGVIDLTPGIRSLQVHYQPEQLPLADLLALISGEWTAVCATPNLQVPSRIVHLPLSWDDPACQLAIEKYMTTVRKDAPWCPSNLEFIRRINDLADLDAVRHSVFEASYLVMGLGDVYLGAPVATPLDPRHRLVTTKYNPARTWTAENSVGIGGAYLCVYGMEGPGGYQFVRRTLQMWNRYREVAAFDGKPWLLRFFDQIRFYPVSAEELVQIRRDFPLGRFALNIEDSVLNLADYQDFLTREAAGIDAFRAHQQQAFNAERERWIASGQAHFDSEEPPAPLGQDTPLKANEYSIDSHIAGNLWQVQVAAGEHVAAGAVLVVLEAMKMEIPLLAPLPAWCGRSRYSPAARLAPASGSWCWNATERRCIVQGPSAPCPIQPEPSNDHSHPLPRLRRPQRLHPGRPAHRRPGLLVLQRHHRPGGARSPARCITQPGLPVPALCPGGRAVAWG